VTETGVGPPSPVPGLADLQVIARGGYSTVYRARQTSVGREVALKIDTRTVDDERDRRRFLREAEAAGRMSGHPHIVHVYDAGVTGDDHPYLVMELCTGGTYAQRLKERGRLPAEEVRSVGVKIADALAAAHSAGILHRDLKPGNILISRYGEPGLADFGLAAPPDPARELSVTVEALTPAYAPPEVFRMERPTARGDVYSLAATLYALLSGRPPRWPTTGTPSLATMVRLHEDPIPDIPGVPVGLTAVLRAAMAADPADRYPTAAAFRDALRSVSLDPATAPPLAPVGMPHSGPPTSGGPTSGGPASGGRTSGGPASGPPTSGPPPGPPVTGRHPSPYAAPTSRAAAGQAGGAGGYGPPPPGWAGAPRVVGGPGGPARPGGPVGPAGRGGGWHSTSPYGPPGARPPSRRGLVAALVAAAVATLVVVVLGGFVLADTLTRDTAADPTRSPGPSETRGQPTPGPTGAPTTAPTGLPTGLPTLGPFGDCPLEIVGARCPTVPECFGDLRNNGNRVTAPRASCGASHTWETFLLGDLPAEVTSVDINTVKANQLVSVYCTPLNLTVALKGASVEGWTVEVLPPTPAAFAGGNREFRCIAGRGKGALNRPYFGTR